MFIDIKEYIKFSREERRFHLKLNESCIEIGGYSKEFKALLAYKLKTTIPFKDNILLCHACHNAKCSNVNHLYWGTHKDNHLDQVENGTHESLWARVIQKYGKDQAHNTIKLAAIKAGIKSGELRKLSDDLIATYRQIIIESEPNKFGWISRAQIKINLSHTQIARFVKKYCSDLKVYKRN